MSIDFSFSRILVDDANQITEVELIPALTKNCQQLVLIGDDKLVPPVSLSAMAKSKGINITIFEKLVKQKIKPILFSVQYGSLRSKASHPQQPLHVPVVQVLPRLDQLDR